MNTKLIIITTIPIYLFFLLIYPLSIDAQTESTKLSYSLDEANLQIGENFTLHINIEDVDDLSGWQCKILFDPEILEAVEVIGGDFLKQGGEIPFFQSGKIDNEAGEITKLLGALSTVGVNGTGRLFSVVFTVIENGETQIQIENVKGTNSNLDVISITPPEIVITIEEKLPDESNDPQLSYTIDDVPIIEGDQFTLNINIDDATDLFGWQSELSFDPNILEANQVVLGDFLKKGGNSPFFQGGIIDNNIGNITKIIATLSSSGVSGTGNLFSVMFTAKAIGNSQIQILNFKATTSDLEPVQLILPEISITVEKQSTINGNIPSLSFSIDNQPIQIHDTFLLHLNIENVIDLSGWLCDMVYDPEYLTVDEVIEGNFLKDDGGRSYFLDYSVDNITGKIIKLGAARFSDGGVSGTGRLLSIKFTAIKIGETEIKLTSLQAGSNILAGIPLNFPNLKITIENREYSLWDVNQDGKVNILDLLHVAQYLRENASVSPESDINKDGTIGILDIIAIAQNIDDTTVAPSNIIYSKKTSTKELMSLMINTWIAKAQTINDGSISFLKGIAKLQELLTSLNPANTILLNNYPNPFNPETWIPFHLGKPTEVTITIYNTGGMIIRTLELGYKDAGFYTSPTQAAYWNGKNSYGERVSSGIYYYTLTTDNYSATRKMLIIK